jgi:DNA-3-methyladenine glycosylase II
MRSAASTLTVRGPWSLETSRAFWEGFTPAALPSQAPTADVLRTVFVAEADWSRVETVVTQRPDEPDVAHLELSGPGDLDAAAVQVARFLALDVDATGWPDIGRRDPVVGDAQRRLQGLRPCGFHSPYEAAAWAVLSQRIRMTQAANLRRDLIARHGDDGAFPSPHVLRDLDLDLPGRKPEYLRAVADAALDGLLDGAALRAVPPEEALASVQEIRGIGPFAAELVVARGANAPDVFPANEGRLAAEMSDLYPAGVAPSDVAEGWRPFRTWASFHLRALHEGRQH